MQSYIQTCTIRCVVEAPILVETSCNHTFKHALFGVWWGPHFSENFMQFHTFLIIYTLLLCLTIFSLHDCMTFPTQIGTPPKEVENEILHVQCLFIYSRYAKYYVQNLTCDFLFSCRVLYFGGNHTILHI